NSETTSTNPVVQAIAKGTAPQPARLAAARGLLPLPQNDLLEVLIALSLSGDTEIATAANETLGEQTEEDLIMPAKGQDTAPNVLAYWVCRHGAPRQFPKAAILNNKPPDDALATLAAATTDGSLLELIAVNQQRLVRSPAIIEAILANPAKTSEAERRAKE